MNQQSSRIRDDVEAIMILTKRTPEAQQAYFQGYCAALRFAINKLEEYDEENPLIEILKNHMTILQENK